MFPLPVNQMEPAPQKQNEIQTRFNWQIVFWICQSTTQFMKYFCFLKDNSTVIYSVNLDSCPQNSKEKQQAYRYIQYDPQIHKNIIYVYWDNASFNQVINAYLANVNSQQGIRGATQIDTNETNLVVVISEQNFKSLYFQQDLSEKRKNKYFTYYIAYSDIRIRITRADMELFDPEFSKDYIFFSNTVFNCTDIKQMLKKLNDLRTGKQQQKIKNAGCYVVEKDCNLKQSNPDQSSSALIRLNFHYDDRILNNSVHQNKYRRIYIVCCNDDYNELKCMELIRNLSMRNQNQLVSNEKCVTYDMNTDTTLTSLQQMYNLSQRMQDICGEQFIFQNLIINFCPILTYTYELVSIFQNNLISKQISDNKQIPHKEKEFYFQNCILYFRNQQNSALQILRILSKVYGAITIIRSDQIYNKQNRESLYCPIVLLTDDLFKIPSQVLSQISANHDQLFARSYYSELRYHIYVHQPFSSDDYAIFLFSRDQISTHKLNDNAVQQIANKQISDNLKIILHICDSQSQKFTNKCLDKDHQNQNKTVAILKQLQSQQYAHQPVFEIQNAQFRQQNENKNSSSIASYDEASYNVQRLKPISQNHKQTSNVDHTDAKMIIKKKDFNDESLKQLDEYEELYDYEEYEEQQEIDLNMNADEKSQQYLSTDDSMENDNCIVFKKSSKQQQVNMQQFNTKCIQIGKLSVSNTQLLCNLQFKEHNYQDCANFFTDKAIERTGMLEFINSQNEKAQNINIFHCTEQQKKFIYAKYEKQQMQQYQQQLRLDQQCFDQLLECYVKLSYLWQTMDEIKIEIQNNINQELFIIGRYNSSHGYTTLHKEFHYISQAEYQSYVKTSKVFTHETYDAIQAQLQCHCVETPCFGNNNCQVYQGQTSCPIMKHAYTRQLEVAENQTVQRFYNCKNQFIQRQSYNFNYCIALCPNTGFGVYYIIDLDPTKAPIYLTNYRGEIVSHEQLRDMLGKNQGDYYGLQLKNFSIISNKFGAIAQFFNQCHYFYNIEIVEYRDEMFIETAVFQLIKYVRQYFQATVDYGLDTNGIIQTGYSLCNCWAYCCQAHRISKKGFENAITTVFKIFNYVVDLYNNCHPNLKMQLIRIKDMIKYYRQHKVNPNAIQLAKAYQLQIVFKNVIQDIKSIEQIVIRGKGDYEKSVDLFIEEYYDKLHILIPQPTNIEHDKQYLKQLSTQCPMCNKCDFITNIYYCYTKKSHYRLMLRRYEYYTQIKEDYSDQFFPQILFNINYYQQKIKIEFMHILKYTKHCINNILVLVQNINGLRSAFQKHQFTDSVRTLLPDIIIMQETHCSSTDFQKMKQQYPYVNVHYDYNTTATSNVGTLQLKRVNTALPRQPKNNTLYVVGSDTGNLQHAQSDDRIQFIHICNNITIINVYAPDILEQNKLFMNDLFTITDNISNSNPNHTIIIAGDFNRNINTDDGSYAVKSFKSQCESHGFQSIFQPDSNGIYPATYQVENTKQKPICIDHVWVSRNSLQMVKCKCVESDPLFYHGDHAAIIMELCVVE